MTEFKVGDRVRYLGGEPDTQGRFERTINKDTDIGIVRKIQERNDWVFVEFGSHVEGHTDGGIISSNCGQNIGTKYLELVKKGAKPKPEDLTRFMAYGTGCDNKSNLYKTEKELKDACKKFSKDTCWTGRLIGYKLTPIFETEEKTTFKYFNTTKLKKVVKKKVGRPKKRK